MSLVSPFWGVAKSIPQTGVCNHEPQWWTQTAAFLKIPPAGDTRWSRLHNLVFHRLFWWFIPHGEVNFSYCYFAPVSDNQRNDFLILMISLSLSLSCSCSCSLRFFFKTEFRSFGRCCLKWLFSSHGQGLGEVRTIHTLSSALPVVTSLQWIYLDDIWL